MELFLLVLIFVGLVGTISVFLPKETNPPVFPLRQIGSFVESEDSAYMPLTTESTEPKIKGPDEKYCQECGSVIRAKAEVCPKCGVRQAVGCFPVAIAWRRHYSLYSSDGLALINSTLAKLGRELCTCCSVGLSFLSLFPLLRGFSTSP